MKTKPTLLLATDLYYQENGQGMIVQPAIDFSYEVSFYFIDQEFCYPLSAPDRFKRWELELFSPSQADKVIK